MRRNPKGWGRYQIGYGPHAMETLYCKRPHALAHVAFYRRIGVKAWVRRLGPL